MGMLRSSSLRFRLMVLTLVSSCAGLLVAFSAFVIYDEHLLREHKVEELRSAADLIETSSLVALIFDDPREADKVLAALRARVHIG
jgi:hypothetical protein